MLLMDRILGRGVSLKGQFRVHRGLRPRQWRSSGAMIEQRAQLSENRDGNGRVVNCELRDKRKKGGLVTLGGEEELQMDSQ